MENVSSNISAIKSPEPNIVTKNKEKPKRKIKRPNVGVVNPSYISKTPIEDTLTIKKQENPQTRYKLTSKKNSAINLNNFTSLVVLGCGFISGFSIFKKIFKK